MPKVVFTERAVKDLKSLNIDTQKRIIDKLKDYQNSLLSYSAKLIHSIIGTYRFRIGDYRVIFDLEADEIIILRIGDRKEIYK